MTALFAYGRLHIRRLARIAVLATTLAAPARAGAPIIVELDQATIAKLPERVSTIVIGNPLIADVALQAGGLMVITGKGYGTTNMIMLDRSGAVLSEQSIRVLGAQENVVVVYRGVSRESYSCAPLCERRVTLGDTPEFFEPTLAQTTNRNQRAQGQAATTPGTPAR
jgi:Pilus formation protein N terminal region